jgi:hypothetical protein
MLVAGDDIKENGKVGNAASSDNKKVVVKKSTKKKYKKCYCKK